MAKRFGRHGVFVGKVVSLRATDGKTFYKVCYTDGDSEEFSKYQLKKYMRQYHTAYGTDSAPASEPSSSLLQSKRLKRALRRRPARTSHAQRVAADRRRR